MDDNASDIVCDVLHTIFLSFSGNNYASAVPSEAEIAHHRQPIILCKEQPNPTIISYL
jgi:hypothetical protein